MRRKCIPQWKERLEIQMPGKIFITRFSENEEMKKKILKEHLEHISMLKMFICTIYLNFIHSLFDTEIA
jgi:hypothetical protein